MAIDTPEKRRAAAGVKRILARVTPNIARDQEWRQQVGRIYSGILALVGVVPKENIVISLDADTVIEVSTDNVRTLSVDSVVVVSVG